MAESWDLAPIWKRAIRESGMPKAALLQHNMITKDWIESLRHMYDRTCCFLPSLLSSSAVTVPSTSAFALAYTGVFMTRHTRNGV